MVKVSLVVIVLIFTLILDVEAKGKSYDDLQDLIDKVNSKVIAK